MCLPLEFTVVGKPYSANRSTSQKKKNWQNNVMDTCQNAINQKNKPLNNPNPYTGEVTVKVFYFPKNNSYCDVDNGLKHLIDGFSEPKPNSKIAAPLPPPPPKLLKDDRNIMRIITERFIRKPGSTLTLPKNMASIAANAIVATDHCTAVKVEAYVANSGGAW